MRPEILAPAGDFERLKIAFHYGADAVYVGGQNYSLRANANNFSLNDLKEATMYAHNLNKKIYVTVNILFHNIDIEGLEEYLLFLNEIKVDAIIVSDILVIRKVKELNLDLNIYLSTQASALNKYCALFYKKLGVKRIVLAREALKSDIQSIKDANLEVECFIHGAMCTSFSGRCVLSNYVTNRDSNRGGCAQICRFLFDVEGNNTKFTMMSKDLNMVENINDMILNKIDSFKIEGRMRSNYYLATVILCYRRIIDLVMNKKLNDEYIKYYLSILNRCANRDSVPQFYNHYPKYTEQYYLDRNEVSNQDYLGIVKSYDYKTKEVTIETKNYFKSGDIVQFLGTDTKTFEMVLDKIYDENMNALEVSNRPNIIIKFRCEKELKTFDMMRLKYIDILPNL